MKYTKEQFVARLREKYNEDFFINNSLLFVQDLTSDDSKLLDVKESGVKITIKIQTLINGTLANSLACCYFIPVSKNISFSNQ